MFLKILKKRSLEDILMLVDKSYNKSNLLKNILNILKDKKNLNFSYRIIMISKTSVLSSIIFTHSIKNKWID